MSQSISKVQFINKWSKDGSILPTIIGVFFTDTDSTTMFIYLCPYSTTIQHTRELLY